MRRALPLLLALVAALATPLAAGPAAADKPTRVVSMNLCTDQLALLLADPGQVVSVTALGARPEDSLMAERATGLALNHGGLEEVLPLRPDLALAGTFTSQVTAAALARLGVPVLELPHAESFADVRANIRRVAAALGTEARGDAVVAAMDRRIERLRRAAAALGPPPRALVYRAGGHTLGPDSLAGAVLTLAGFENAAEAYGIARFGDVPVDGVLALSPDLLIVGVYRAEGPSLARDVTHHPAIRARGVATLAVPTRRWGCGLPAALDVAEQLIAWRKAWETGS